MFLPFVFCVVFLLQNVFGSPMPEMDDEPEWVPRYTRDFEIFDSDHWYKWWYGGKRKTSTLERIQLLESRQKVLFDLVLCESHNRLRTFVTDECELFRKKAEQVFGVPAKGAPVSTTTVVPQGSTPVATAQPTTVPPSSTIVPQEVTTVVSTAAPTTISPVVTSAAAAPVTQAPVTPAAVTQAPVTPAAVTQAPVTPAAVTQAPVTPAAA